MKNIRQRSLSGFVLVLGATLLLGGRAAGQTTYSGACSINGACAVKSSIQCTSDITAQRLGGGTGTYLGDGTTCTLACSVLAYPASRALPFQFATVDYTAHDASGRPMVLETPLSLTLTSWSVKNASSGQTVASGTTAPALGYPIVKSGKAVVPPSTYANGPNPAFVTARPTP